MELYPSFITREAQFLNPRHLTPEVYDGVGHILTHMDCKHGVMHICCLTGTEAGLDYKYEQKATTRGSPEK